MKSVIIGGIILSAILFGGGLYVSEVGLPSFSSDSSPDQHETKSADQEKQTEPQDHSSQETTSPVQESSPPQSNSDSVTSSATAAAGVHDCGTDMTCFIEKAQTCQPAEVDVTIAFDFFGMIQTSLYHQTIVGPTEGLCEVRFRYDDVRVTYGPAYREKAREEGITEEEIAQAEEEARQTQVSLLGLESVCLFDSETLNAFLTAEQVGNAGGAYDYLERARCEGDLF